MDTIQIKGELALKIINKYNIGDLFTVNILGDKFVFRCINKYAYNMDSKNSHNVNLDCINESYADNRNKNILYEVELEKTSIYGAKLIQRTDMNFKEL